MLASFLSWWRSSRHLTLGFLVIPTLIAVLGGTAVLVGSTLGSGEPPVLAVIGALLGGLVGQAAGRWLLTEWRAVEASGGGTGPRPALVVLAVVALCTASTGYSRIDAVLHAFHQPGDASYGADATASPFTLGLSTWCKVLALVLVGLHLVGMVLLRVRHSTAAGQGWMRVRQFQAATLRLILPVGLLARCKARALERRVKFVRRRGVGRGRRRGAGGGQCRVGGARCAKV